MHRSVYDWDGQETRRRRNQRFIIGTVTVAVLVCAAIWLGIELVIRF